MSPRHFTNTTSAPLFIITVSTGIPSNPNSMWFETVGGKIFTATTRAAAEEQEGWTLTGGYRCVNIRELAPGATYVLGE